MRRLFIIITLLLALTLVLAACGGGSSDTTESEESADLVARGEELYKSTTIGPASSPGCVTCHSLEPGVTLVGPSHAGVASRAANYTPGVSAEDYLRESILNPDAHVVEGFAPGVMYQNYANELSDDQVDALVAYLLTLK